MKPCSGKEFFVPRSPAFSANASRSNIRAEVLSKLELAHQEIEWMNLMGNVA
jgi:hypothetical protein